MEQMENRYIESLLNRFPNLKQEFDEYTIREEDCTYAALDVYDDIFIPFIIKQLIRDNREEMIKIADYIEELLQFNDPDYPDYDFLASSVLKSLKKRAGWPADKRISEREKPERAA